MSRTESSKVLGRLRGAVLQLLQRLRRRSAPGVPEGATRRAEPPRGGAASSARAATQRMATFTFTCRAGTRAYSLFVPPDPPEQPQPLLVMLHGCRQTPDDFATGTRMNSAAGPHGIVVAYPAQSRAANRTLCWNWFRAADQARDLGEAAIIAELTQELVASRRLDRTRVYIAGLSAGGAMTSAVLAAYPEIFAAAGIHSGIPSGRATGVGSALFAMRLGAGYRAPAVAAAGEPHVPFTPLIVFQGDSDRTVHPDNARTLYSDAVKLSVAGTRANADTTDVTTEYPATEQTYATTRISSVRPGGKLSDAEFWLAHGAGHAWLGGTRAGSFADPRGPSASEEMLRFFLQHRRLGSV